MSDRQMQAVAGLGLAVGLVVVARQIARSQGAALGLTPAVSVGLVMTSATAAGALFSGRRA